MRCNALLCDTHHLDGMWSDAQLGGGTARSDTPEMMEFLFFALLLQILQAFALPVQPVLLPSTPRTSWESLSCPLGADRAPSRPPTRAFVVSFVCVMDWPGYFAAQTSPRGRETEPRVPATPANSKPRCLHVPVGKMGHGQDAGFRDEVTVVEPKHVFLDVSDKKKNPKRHYNKKKIQSKVISVLVCVDVGACCGFSTRSNVSVSFDACV